MLRDSWFGSRLPSLSRSGPWLWLAIALGAAVRGWLVFRTGGTLDVDTWAGHAWEITQRGMIAYYHGGEHIFNHPPLMGEVFSRLYVVAAQTGLPFAALLRAPTALLDFGTALLVWKLLEDDPRRWALFAAYWLLPLAIIFSSYHGNTDSAIAFFVLGAVILVGKQRAAAAGAVLGLGLWIKVPVVLAIPALAFGLVGARERLTFALSFAAVGLASYVPALIADPRVVIDSVFLYPGLQIQTPAGIQIWGNQVFFPDPMTLPAGWREPVERLTRGIYLSNTWITLLPIVFVAWARRAKRNPLEIAGNVGASYVIFHGLTNFWGFQYLAWALPLWLVAGGRFALPALLLTTVYIYGLNVWLCGDFALAGKWDFVGKARWPGWLLLSRNASILFFFASAIFLVTREATRSLQERSERSG